MTLSFNSTIPTTASSYVSATGTAQASYVTFNTTTVLEVRTTTYLYAAQFAASPLVIRYRAGDLTASDPLQSPTSGPAASNTPSSGLSPGAKAGIGVGAVLSVLALLAVGFLLFRRRQKRTAALTPPAADAWSPADHKAELHNETVQPKEMPAHGHGYQEVSQMRTGQGNGEVAELGAYR
jgi:hypothetical protein